MTILPLCGTRAWSLTRAMPRTPSKNIARKSSAVNRNIFRALFCEAKLSGVFGVYRLPMVVRVDSFRSFVARKNLSVMVLIQGWCWGAFRSLLETAPTGECIASQSHTNMPNCCVLAANSLSGSGGGQCKPSMGLQLGGFLSHSQGQVDLEGEMSGNENTADRA